MIQARSAMRADDSRRRTKLEPTPDDVPAVEVELRDSAFCGDDAEDDTDRGRDRGGLPSFGARPRRIERLHAPLFSGRTAVTPRMPTGSSASFSRKGVPTRSSISDTPKGHSTEVMSARSEVPAIRESPDALDKCIRYL